MFRRFQTLVPDGKYFKHVYDVPMREGFYVLRYKDGHEEKVWLSKPEDRGSNVYSYAATYHNYRDADTCMDMGQYVWVNSYTTHGPVEWRRMGVDEALEFSNTLCMFGRLYWGRKEGRRPLSRQDVEFLQRDTD